MNRTQLTPSLSVWISVNFLRYDAAAGDDDGGSGGGDGNGVVVSSNELGVCGLYFPFFCSECDDPNQIPDSQICARTMKNVLLLINFLNVLLRAHELLRSAFHCLCFILKIQFTFLYKNKSFQLNFYFDKICRCVLCVVRFQFKCCERKKTEMIFYSFANFECGDIFVVLNALKFKQHYFNTVFLHVRVLCILHSIAANISVLKGGHQFARQDD